MNKAITNSSGKSLTINGGGTITSASSINIVSNEGTLTTTNVVLSSTIAANGTYIVANYGNYTANNNTQIINAHGSGLAIYKGNIVLNGTGTVLNTEKNSLVVVSSPTGNVNITISGATITSVSTEAVKVSNTSYTATLNMSSGSIIGGNASNAYSGITTSGDGTKTINITGGFVRGYHVYGINMGTGTLNVGTSSGTFSRDNPVIVGNTYAVRTTTNSNWAWGSGALYGSSANGNYSSVGTTLRPNYTRVTVSDTTYGSGGYKSYLMPSADVVFEITNSSGSILNYASTLASAFSLANSNNKIRPLVDNTVSDVAITNSKGINLNTDGKTIILNKTITNAVDKSLILSGGGTITTSSAITLIDNNGTLTTLDVTLSNTKNSNTNYVVRNAGQYSCSQGTVISNTYGRGIVHYGGILAIFSSSEHSTNITTASYAIIIPSAASDMTQVSISGAYTTINSTNTVAITVQSNSFSSSVYMSSGTVGGIVSSGSGAGNIVINIQGGYVISNGVYGISANTTGALTTVNIGIYDDTYSGSSPQIVGSSYGVNTAGSAIWNFYDGRLYGSNATANYTADPSTKNPSNYYIRTISDEAYATNGYRTYLTRPYVMYDSDNATTGYADTLSEAFANVQNNGTIRALVDNTSTVAITNSKNVRLHTGTCTITLNKSITNSSGKTLTITGGGKITSASNMVLISNSGTLSVYNTEITRTGSSYVIYNLGDFALNSGTIITNTNGPGIAFYKGTMTIKSGAIIATSSSAIAHLGAYNGWSNTGDITITMSGGLIDAGGRGIQYYNDVTNSFNMTMSGGSIVTTGIGIYIGTAASAGTNNGSASIRLTGGEIKSTGASEAVYVARTNSSVFLGNNNSDINSFPKLINTDGNFAIRVNSGSWYWYDGFLYGINSGRGYYSAPASTASSYPISITADTTYNSSGYRSYLNASGGNLITYTPGQNVSAVEATSGRCIPSSGTSCQVILPSFTPNSGYSNIGWSTSSGSVFGAPIGSSYSLTSSSTTLYANAIPTEQCFSVDSGCNPGVNYSGMLNNCLSQCVSSCGAISCVTINGHTACDTSAFHACQSGCAGSCPGLVSDSLVSQCDLIDNCADYN